MKILIVDDNADTKCVGIMEECKKREIEVEVALSSKQGLFSVFSNNGNLIDGIILDMDLPIFPYGENINEREGEDFLRELSRKERYIPTLLFSEVELQSNYVQFFAQMRNWDEDNNKFFAFLEKLQKDKELKEEQERQKELEEKMKEEQLT